MATKPIMDKSAAPDPVADRLLLAEELLSLVERAQAHTHAAGSTIALQCGEKLIIRTSTGAAPEVGTSLPIGEGAIGACARTGKPLNMSEEGKLDTAVRALSGRSVAAVPIHHNGISYGVLAVIGTTAEAFTRMHVAIMMTMGNEAARVLKRLESVTSEIAPGVPIGAVPAPAADRVAPILQIDYTARQDIVETIKKFEQPLRPKVEATKAEIPRPMPPAESKTLHPAQQVAAMSFIDLEADRAQPQPLPDLLPPGEDPRKFGTLKNAKSLQPKPTFAMSSTYRPSSSSSRKAPAMAVVVLVMVLAGYGVLRHRSATAAAHAAPAPPQEPVAAAVSPAPVSTPQPEPAKLIPAAVIPEAAPAKTLTAKLETPKAEPVKTEAAKAETAKKTAEVTEEAPKPKAVQEPPLHIAAPSKKNEVAAVEAPSLTLTGGAMPELSAPKVPAASLAVKRSTAAPPELLRSVQPVYPDVARRNGTFGDVRMQLKVSAEGKVTDVKILQGNPVLAQAATYAVRQWQYRPATMDGHTIESTVDVVVKFGQH